MNKPVRTGVLVAVAVLVAALAGFAYVAGSIYFASVQMRHLGASVFTFATQTGRVPGSLEEMVREGYIRPAGTDQPDKFLVLNRAHGEPVGSAIDVDRYEVSWGAQPGQLIQREKILYWRERPDERALLVRDKKPPLAIRVLGGRLAMAFPRELYYELGGPHAGSSVPATQTQPATP